VLHNLASALCGTEPPVHSTALRHHACIARPRVSALVLFLTFSRITLSAFGGLQFWARRALVERQRWLTEQEFVDLLALGHFCLGRTSSCGGDGLGIASPAGRAPRRLSPGCWAGRAWW